MILSGALLPLLITDQEECNTTIPITQTTRNEDLKTNGESDRGRINTEKIVAYRDLWIPCRASKKSMFVAVLCVSCSVCQNG